VLILKNEISRKLLSNFEKLVDSSPSAEKPDQIYEI
jgi:hypothetical protein